MSYLRIARDVNNYNATNKRNQIVNDRSNQFLAIFKSAPEYEGFRIGQDDAESDIDYDAWIYTKNSHKEIISKKDIIFAPNTPSNIVASGQFIRPQRQGGIFLTTSIDKQYSDKLKAEIMECNFNLEFINDVGKQLSIPCVLKSEASGTDGGKYVTIGKNQRMVIIQRNDETLKFARDDEFIIDGITYRIRDINSVENPGILYIEFTEYQEGAVETHVYTLNILQENLAFIISQTVQLDVVVKEDDAIVTKPIVYTSSDTGVVTVSETGLLTAISDGTATITATLRDNDAISDTVSIEIQQTPVDNIEYRFGTDNLNELIEYDTNSYDFNKYINDTIDPVSFTFSIDYNGNSTNIATLETIDGNNCRVIANSQQIYGTIFLVANEGVDERGRIEINIISLWG